MRADISRQPAYALKRLTDCACSFVVIPAKAGIQWLRQYISVCACLQAQTEMTLTQAGPLADLLKDVIHRPSVAVKYLAGLWRECLLADTAKTDQARLAE